MSWEQGQRAHRPEGRKELAVFVVLIEAHGGHDEMRSERGRCEPDPAGLCRPAKGVEILFSVYWEVTECFKQRFRF